MSTRRKGLLPCENKSRHRPRLASSDHLINLHESVLSLILSILPAKDAIRTSILSKDWKYKWTCMYHVEIADSFRSVHQHSVANFVNFVERILLFAHKLTSFSLTCFLTYDEGHVMRWIYDVFGRENIGSLEIKLIAPLQNKTNIVLPWSLLNISSRRNFSLRLPGFSLNVVGHENSFLNLISFHLSEIQILNGNPGSDTLVLNFPALTRFEVNRCKWVDIKFVKIIAPILETFVSSTYIHQTLSETFQSGDEDYNYSVSIQIIGPRLTTYKSTGDKVDNVILTGSQIVSACFENEFEIVSLLELTSIGLQVRNILNETSRLNELALSDFMVQALRTGPPLRRQDEMKRLVLHRSSNIEQLFELLHVAPSLTYLVVNVYEWDSYNYDKNVELLPRCIVSHLEEVRLEGFHGWRKQFDFARCLLKYGQALRKISILNCHANKHDIIVNKLSMFPRFATRLTIDFPGRQVPPKVFDKKDQILQQLQRPKRKVCRPVRLA